MTNPELYSHQKSQHNPGEATPRGLAVEVIGRQGSIAWHDTDDVQSRGLPESVRATSGLGTLLDAYVTNPDFVPPQFIAVADGPGSFTGLRIAMTTAKTLAYAWNIPIIGIDSLAAIASMAVQDSAKNRMPVRVAINAYRGQVFTARFDASADPTTYDALARDDKQSDRSRLMSQDDWKHLLQTPDEAHLATGDSDAFQSADRQVWQFMETTQPIAQGVLALAMPRYQSGQSSSAIEAMPRYFRPSAAEEKADQRTALM